MTFVTDATGMFGGRIARAVEHGDDRWLPAHLDALS
jgi:hypothetical protein